MMKNLVSVLVPVFGVETYMERCARSLFGQRSNTSTTVIVSSPRSVGNLIQSIVIMASL